MPAARKSIAAIMSVRYASAERFIFKLSKNVVQKLTLIVIIFLLSGCVGVATMHNPEKKHEDLKFKLMGRGFLFDNQEENHNYSKSDVVEVWGQPDSKEVSGNVEYWRYKQGVLAWAGVIPMIVIPIPLVAPVGKNSVTLGFIGNELVSATSQYRHGSLAVCGMFLMDNPSGLKFGCFTGSE